MPGFDKSIGVVREVELGPHGAVTVAVDAGAAVQGAQAGGPQVQLELSNGFSYCGVRLSAAQALIIADELRAAAGQVESWDGDGPKDDHAVRQDGRAWESRRWDA